MDGWMDGWMEDEHVLVSAPSIEAKLSTISDVCPQIWQKLSTWWLPNEAVTASQSDLPGPPKYPCPKMMGLRVSLLGPLEGSRSDQSAMESEF